jgi:ATP-binding cassette subfamily F protein 2
MSTQVSASKAKRLAAKAAREAKSGKSSTKNTPIPSGNNSTEDLGMDNLKLNMDRTATGVYSSQERSRDIKIESYSLNYFGRVLIENANIELNFGRRYGLVGSNGSGKSTFLHSIAEKDIEIPDHIDVSDSNVDDDEYDDEREGRD